MNGNGDEIPNPEDEEDRFQNARRVQGNNDNNASRNVSNTSSSYSEDDMYPLL